MRIATTIYDNLAKRNVPAELIIGVDAGIIEKVGRQWKRERIQKALQGKASEHFHWDWGQKASHVNGLLAYDFFALECQGTIEGLMLTESVCHRAEIPPDEGKPILYIEFIEAAPRNTVVLNDISFYRDIGTRLIEGAVNFSMEQGFEGRVGLLTLSQAEQFYRKMGFEKVRFDSKERLYYYERTAKTSKQLLDKGNKYDISNEQR